MALPRRGATVQRRVVAGLRLPAGVGGVAGCWVRASDSTGRLFRRRAATHFGAAGRSRSLGTQDKRQELGWEGAGRSPGPKQVADVAGIRMLGEDFWVEGLIEDGSGGRGARCRTKHQAMEG